MTEEKVGYPWLPKRLWNPPELALHEVLGWVPAPVTIKNGPYMRLGDVNP